MEKLLDSLKLASDERPDAEDDHLSPLEWAKKYRRIDDRQFTLENHKPLKALYEDKHPYIVVLKPAQVGVSEWAITRVLHTLDVGARYWKTQKEGLNVGYVFSTDRALSSFSKERFSGLRTETPHLAELFTSYDDVGFKQAGASYLYLRGGKSGSALKSFAADELVLDEYDEMSPVQVALVEKRLRASVLKLQKRLSTPTFPNYGIHALYLQSDQQVWEVPCAHCGDFNELEFFRDVRADGIIYDVWKTWEQERLRAAKMAVACPSCKVDLDRCADGRWTQRQPHIKGIRGYHVPSLCFPSVSLNDLAVNAVSTDPSQVTEFYRSDLGLPYEPAGSRITADMLNQLSHELVNGQLPDALWSNTTMGVDVGSRLHFRISSTGPDKFRYVRKMGSVKEWSDLDELMAHFKVRHCVIDALPEIHACVAWAEKHKGKVLRAFYPNAAALKGRLFRLPGEAKDKADVSEEQEAHTIQINRTMAMDAVYNLVATAAERWPAAIHKDAEVQAHMKAPVRVVTKDHNGQESVAWVHTAPDHLYHATLYDMVALQTLPKPVMGVFTQGSAKGW